MRPPARALSSVALLAACFAAAGALAQQSLYLSLAAPAVVRIEAGWFEMGSDDEDVARAVRLCEATMPEGGGCGPALFVDEQPRRRIYLSAYAIDRTEVSNAAYRRCVAAGVCAPSRTSDEDVRLGLDEQPVSGVRHDEASRYCAWVGGQLPTEAQWERAARNGSRRDFPWGEDYNGRVANHGSGMAEPDPGDGYDFAAPVTAFPDGKSAYGLLNMAGNVWELVADRYAPRAYQTERDVDPTGPEDGDAYVVRGGSWRSPVFALRVSHRGKVPATESHPDVGFRCAYNVAADLPSGAPKKGAPTSGPEMR